MGETDNIRAILFDLDGTLVDSAVHIAGLLNGMRGETGKPGLEMICYRRWISLGGAQLLRRALEIPEAAVPDALADFRRRYLETETPPEILYPTVAATLQRLAATGMRLGVCSNKPERLCRKVLADTRLDGYFGAVVGGDSAPVPKPGREPVDMALAALETPTGAALFVGDSSIDQHAAAAAGVPFVFYCGGYDDGVDRTLARACLDRLEELAALVFDS